MVHEHGPMTVAVPSESGFHQFYSFADIQSNFIRMNLSKAFCSRNEQNFC